MSQPPGTSNNPNNAKKTGPTPIESMKDMIIVASTPPDSNARGNDAPCFAPSSKINRTPPQATSHPTSPPDVPGQPTRGKHSAQTGKDKNGEKNHTKETSNSAPINNSPSPQHYIEKTPIQKAQEMLNTAAGHLHQSFQPAASKVGNGADPNTVTVEIPYLVLQEIGNKVVEALQHIKQHTEHPKNIEERLDRIEKALKESMTRSPKSYAETAAAAAATTPETQETHRAKEIQQRNQERKRQERRERAKFEVTLTTQEANANTKEQLAEQSHAAITAKLQETANSQLKDKTPNIKGIQKLKSHDIRIHCNTAEEAEQLRKIEWNKAYDGLTTRRPKYGIVIPGIPTNSISPNDTKNPELIKQLNQQNKENELEIIEVKPLRRKLKGNPRYFSLVAFVTKPEKADHCIKHGIYINHQRFPAQKYTPQFQFVQCYKCNQLGHHAATCKSPHEVCGKCSGHHPTSQCESETCKCANCKGEHFAWDDNCPSIIREKQHLASCRRGASAYHNE
jgi:hypothetical protein